MPFPNRPGIAAMLLLAAAGTAASARDEPEAKLDKALAGRIAGPPVDCLQQYTIRSSRIFDRTAILYETSGGVLYVNRPRSGAAFLHGQDYMVTDTHTGQLCSVDIVRLYDNASHIQDGVVGLGAFVPYTRPRAG